MVAIVGGGQVRSGRAVTTPTPRARQGRAGQGRERESGNFWREEVKFGRASITLRSTVE